MAGFHATLVSRAPQTGMWTLYTLSPPDLDVQVDRLLRGSEWCLHLIRRCLLHLAAPGRAGQFRMSEALFT